MNYEEVTDGVKEWAMQKGDAMRTQPDALMLADYMVYMRGKNIADQIMQNRDACLKVLSEVRALATRIINDAEEVSIKMLPENCQDTHVLLFNLLNKTRPESIDRKTIGESIPAIRKSFATWISKTLETLNKAGHKKSTFVAQTVDTSKYRMLTQEEIPEGLMQILHKKNSKLSAAETDVLRFLLSHIGTQVLQEECMMAGGIDTTEAGERRLISIMSKLQKLFSSLSCTLTVTENHAYTLMPHKDGSTPPWIQTAEPLVEENSDPAKDVATLSSVGRLLQDNPNLSIDDFLNFLNTRDLEQDKKIPKDWLEWVLRDENACTAEVMTGLQYLLARAAHAKKAITQTPYRPRDSKDAPPQIEESRVSDLFKRKFHESKLKVIQLCALHSGQGHGRISQTEVTQFLDGEMKLPTSIVKTLLHTMSVLRERAEVQKIREELGRKEKQ